MENKTSILLVALAAGLVGFTVGETVKIPRAQQAARVMTRTTDAGEEVSIVTESQTIARPKSSRPPEMVATRTNRFMD